MNNMLPALTELMGGLEKIVEYSDEYNDYKIMFMHPHGPSVPCMWPKPLDLSWIPCKYTMKILAAPSIN